MRGVAEACLPPPDSKKIKGTNILKVLSNCPREGWHQFTLSLKHNGMCISPHLCQEGVLLFCQAGDEALRSLLWMPSPGSGD